MGTGVRGERAMGCVGYTLGASTGVQPRGEQRDRARIEFTYFYVSWHKTTRG